MEEYSEDRYVCLNIAGRTTLIRLLQCFDALSGYRESPKLDSNRIEKMLVHCSGVDWHRDSRQKFQGSMGLICEEQLFWLDFARAGVKFIEVLPGERGWLSERFYLSELGESSETQTFVISGLSAVKTFFRVLQFFRGVRHRGPCVLAGLDGRAERRGLMWRVLRGLYPNRPPLDADLGFPFSIQKSTQAPFGTKTCINKAELHDILTQINGEYDDFIKEMEQEDGRLSRVGFMDAECL